MAAVAELEHFIGYDGKYLNTVHYHPLKAETLIYAAAAVIIIEDVNDPHKQEFLRGHDADITALDVSQNGKLLASGQLGSPSQKGAVAPVIVWDFDNRQRYIEFNGLAHSVLCIRFSYDGRYLVGTGANQMIFLWDVQTGEQVYSRRTESPCFLTVWGPIMEPSSGSRYPSYVFCTAYDNQVLQHQMAFDIRSMCYAVNSEVMQFPSSGLQRKHVCGLCFNGYLITGTTAGDLCIFSLKNSVFRSSLPICNNGVASIAQCKGFLYVAGGDGRVKAVRGNDTHWDVIAENVLESGVVSFTPAADGAELVAGTKNGKLWRLLSSDLTATLQACAHTGEVTSVSFGTSSDVVCTASIAGEVSLVNLSDYMPIATALHKSPVQTAVICKTQRPEMIVGYDDGFLRSWELVRGETVMQWQFHAHRGGVTVVKEGPDFIVSGGNDFNVRFWHRTTRELLATFQNHRKPVADIVIDICSPHLAHSGAEDRLVTTYDLKVNKAKVQHYTQSSSITGLSQRKDNENEVVSSTLDGKILFWDVDYADPTGCLDGIGPVRLRCCDVSPVGRYIAAGAEDAHLYIFDLAECRCVQACAGHSKEITAVRWSPDQKQIVTAGKDGCVIIWNFFEL